MNDRAPFRSAVCFPLLALVAVGCGVFGAEDSEVAAPQQPSGDLPPGAPPPTTGTPSTDEVTEAFGVFVAPSGNDQGSGTRQSPFATIGAAIQAAKPQAKRVYVCAGTYAESVELVSAVSMIGGYDCSDATAWKRAPGARSTLAGKSIPAVRAKGVTSTTRFEGFDVTAPDAKEAGASSIGLWADGAGKLAVADASFRAGKGGDGAPGTTPPPPNDGPNASGGVGTAGVYDYPTPVGNVYPYPAAPVGGTSACGGGAGGAGGRGGVWACDVTLAGNNLVIATRFNAVTQQSVPIGPPVPEETRTPSAGGSGTDATSARAAGTLSATGFVPSDGTVGTNGGPGAGGSGGSYEGLPATCYAKNYYTTLGNGGGGAAGGCGGIAGTAGRGGGASIAAFVLASDGLAFTGVTLEGGAGGAGGEGSFGSEPTKGGTAGLGGPKTLGGQNGSPGGRAGVSGSGAGGSSFGLVYSGAPPVQKDTTLKAGTPGAGVPEKTWTSTVTGQKATMPASVAGEAKDVASF